METIEPKSRIANGIFYTVLVLLILGSVITTYFRIVVYKDYQIIAEVSCDPNIESCFKAEEIICDGTDESCEATPSYYYKQISKKAADIYACEQTTDKIDCTDELSCLKGEKDCFYILNN